MSDLFLRPLFTWRSAVASAQGPANPTTRHVLLTLALHMSEKGDSCFPSTRLLAEETGLSHKSVITHLQAAAEAGWLGKRERRLSNGQGWRRVEYFALIPQEVEAFHAKQRDEPGSSRQGDEPSSPPAQEVGERGERGSQGDERGSRRDEPDGNLHIKGSTSRSTPRGKARSRAHDGEPLPADFKISDNIRAWAEGKGYTPYLEAHFEYFVTWARNGKNGKPRLYLDWDGTFRNAMLGDYGDVRKNARMDRQYGPKLAATTVDRSCTEDVGAGERCGMDGEAHGDTFICPHHWRIRMERSRGSAPIDKLKAALKGKRVAA